MRIVCAMPERSRPARWVKYPMSLAATSESVLERNGMPISMSSRRSASKFTSVPLCASAMTTSSTTERCGCADSQPLAPAVP